MRYVVRCNRRSGERNDSVMTRHRTALQNFISARAGLLKAFFFPSSLNTFRDILSQVLLPFNLKHVRLSLDTHTETAYSQWLPLRFVFLPIKTRWRRFSRIDGSPFPLLSFSFSCSFSIPLQIVKCRFFHVFINSVIEVYKLPFVKCSIRIILVVRGVRRVRMMLRRRLPISVCSLVSCFFRSCYINSFRSRWHGFKCKDLSSL